MQFPHKSIAIVDRSSIGEARRAAVWAAQALGLDEDCRSNVGIVATEAATNVLLHAQSGEFLVCPSSFGGTVWLDLIALDSGPGIGDVSRAMEDGFSSIGTAGQGLGAIERLSSVASLYSVPGKGTAYWSRFSKGKPVPYSAVGVISIPVHGETTCGDSFYIKIDSARSLYMVVDGLGHGQGATEAAQEAVLTVEKYAHEPLTEILSRAHDALKRTRGAAMSLAAVDHNRRIISYAGVGNISASIITGANTRSLVSQNGTLGAILPRVLQEYVAPIEESSSILMYSDGLTTRVNTASYPGLQNRHPILVSGVLYRDFGRRRDDATVMFAPVGGIVE